jgi:DNA-binding response OmpR family regulator
MTASELPGDAAPPRVLLVEDDPVIAGLLEEVLRDQGYTVEHVEDGAAGLARIDAGGIDLVLLDRMLPNVDGLALCRQVRLAAPEHDVYLPIMMVTSLASAADRQVGFEAGADDYVPKPFDPEEILARARVWLRVRLREKEKRAALLRQQAALHEAEQRAVEARLEGVTLATREIANLLSNDMQAPVSAIELLRLEASVPPSLRDVVDAAAESLEKATEHLQQLQQVVRVAVKSTPVGPSLDLPRSIQREGADEP